VAVSLLISAYVTIIMIRIIVISGLINRRTISGINTLRYKKSIVPSSKLLTELYYPLFTDNFNSSFPIRVIFGTVITE